MLLSYDANDNKAGIQILEDLTVNASQVQQQVLKEILTENAQTQYLTSFLNGQSDKLLFKNKVPVVNYEDIRTYIQRVANGEPSQIIMAQPITELIISSGTSGGKMKMMPTTTHELDRKTVYRNLAVSLMSKHVDGLDQGKGMYLMFAKPEITTPSGLKAMAALTSYYKSTHFRNRPFNKFDVYTSPNEAILCPDTNQSMFSQLLCGLVLRQDVTRVGSVLASPLLMGIKFLQDHWREMCCNIRTGRVSDWITDPACRNAVSLVLGEPNPDLADSIERECSASSWEGIIKKLWPRTKFIEAIVTGSMAQYIPTLEFYGGGVPLASVKYGCSECYLGLNLKPLCNPYDVSYTLLPNMAYFEFLPMMNNILSVEDAVDDQQVEPVELVDVKLGQCYELLVTTYAGLYRYKVGDILKVTGFHNKAPQFKFMHRQNVVLSIDVDKTYEKDLINAVTSAYKLLLEPLGILLSEYTSYAYTCSIPGHYVLFWELTKKGKKDMLPPDVDPVVMEQCCSSVEEALDPVYRCCRRVLNSVGPLEIRIVKPNSFDALLDYYVSRGSSVSQYKTPRCIAAEEAFKILDSRVMGKFFSNKTPSWVQSEMEAK